jgi:hypothetical protein
MSKTPLFVRRQAGGVFTVVNESLTTGDIYFVDSGQTSTGSDAVGYGQNPDAPFLTLDYAIGQCTANQGDRIYVMPGHAENITAADSVDIDQAGIEIIGIGLGADIPTFSATAAAGSITIDAASVTIRNIKMVANFATGCTSAFTITASGDNCTLDGIVCRDTTTDKEWLVHVSVATTVTDLTIKNCDFVGLAGGTMTGSIVFAGTTSNIKILDNYIDVDSSDSVIHHDTDKATSCLLARNIILNQDTDAAGYCIEMEATSTGQAIYNCCNYDKNDAVVYLGEAMFWIENYGGNTAGSSGELDPAAVAIP